MKFVKPILLLSFLAIYFFLVQQNRFIQDDAFINFRYVENLLAGHGLVYNVGEHVEGFTSFSWMILLLIFKLTGLDLISFSQYSSIFFGALIFVVIYFLSNKSSKPILVFLATSVLILSSSGFIYWSVSGMESSLFSLLILIMFYSYLAKDNLINNPIFFIISFFAIITRQEAFAVFTIFLFYDFLNSKEIYQLKKNQKIIILKVTITLLPFILLVLIRIYYYGYIFPNTYYAKTNLILPYFFRGFEYIINWIKFDFLYGILLIPFIVLVYKKKEKIEILVLILLSFYLIYNLYIGGDVLPHNRFFLPILPIIYFSISKSFFDLIESKSAIIVSIIVILVISFLKHNLNLDKIIYTKEHEVGLVKKMKIYADYLNENNPNKTAVLSTIGSFGYYYNGNVIDMVGLTDEYIAHHPKEINEIDDNVPVGWKERTYNIDYIFKSRPDFIIFPAGYKPTAFPEAAIFSDNRFYKYYKTELIFNEDLNQMLPLFVKRNIPLTLSSNCENNSRKWISNFIDGNNLYLEFTRTNNDELINKIEADAVNIVQNKCRENEGFLLLGMLRFRQKLYNQAFGFFERIIINDPLNAIAYYYLMQISSKQFDNECTFYYTGKLKEISPGALPNLVIKK